MNSVKTIKLDNSTMKIFYVVFFLMMPGILFSEHEHKRFAARTNYCPQWSPDGSTILFYSEINGKWQIMSIKNDGTQMSRLSNADHDDYYPSYSPSGKQIVFYSKRGGYYNIYTADPDGKNQVRLTIDPKRSDKNPRWSPDGIFIAFVSTSEDGLAAVEIMKSDGSGRTRVSNPSNHVVVSRLSWSSDSSRVISYVSNDGKEMSEKNLWTLFSFAIDGKKTEQLDPEWRRDSNPDWSGAAGLILFDAHKKSSWESDDGGWEIFSAKLDGKERLNLTKNEKQNEWGPSWSPDGKSIAYSSGMDDRYEIFIMNADGSNPRRLTFNVR